MQGKYFEELEIGDEFPTRGRTLTETDIVLYAGLSWDHNPEHTDTEFAKSTVFKERVAHMLLSLVFTNGLSASTGFLRGTARGFLGLTWQTLAVCRIGDTLRVVERISKKEASPRPSVGVVTIEIDVINQRGEMVSRGERTMLVAHLRKPEEKEQPWEFAFTLEAHGR